MTDRFVEGALFALIVWLAFYAFMDTPSSDQTCYMRGNPGSYVCE